jgi:hypothetical protein
MILFLTNTSSTGELYSKLLNIDFVLLILSSVASIYANNPVVAQTSETTSSTSPETTGLPPFKLHHLKTVNRFQQVNLQYKEYLQMTKRPIVRCMLMLMT